MIAFPGSTAYARNHGVYLTDPQVVSPLRWQHHGQLSQPRVASRSCALVLDFLSWSGFGRVSPVATAFVFT